jgi:hypothetical protein
MSGLPQIPEPFSLAPTHALLTGKANKNIVRFGRERNVLRFRRLLGVNYLTGPTSDGSDLRQEQAKAHQILERGSKEPPRNNRGHMNGTHASCSR